MGGRPRAPPLLLVLAALLLPAALAAAPAPAAAQGTAPAPATDREALALAIAGEVSGRNIHDLVAELTTDPATAYRMVGTPSHDAAADWVAAQFADLGLEPVVFEHACEVRQRGRDLPVPTPGRSVMALVEGRQRAPGVLVGGHYDTRETSTGALDNAAGTAAVLELARVFAAHRGALGAGALFVAWDCEEWGVWGSREFVARLPEVEALLGLDPGALDLRMAVSLDMPGLNWPAANAWPTYHKGEFSVMHVRTSPIDTFGYKASYGEYNQTNYTADQLQGFRDYRTLVKRAAFDLLGYPPRWVWVEDDAHGRSDHVPFIAAGIPGMRVHGPSDEEYPPYHTAGDTLPAVHASAGGEERFVAGLESAARLTALTAALVALPPEPGQSGGAAGAPAGPGSLAVPGPGAPVVAAGALAVALAVAAAAGTGADRGGGSRGRRR